MTTGDQLYERSLYEARLDATYYARLHERHARLYRRIRVCIIIVTLIAGSTAFANVLKGNSFVIGISGIVVAVMSILDVAFDFGSRAAAHDVQRRRYTKLIRDWPEDLDAVERALARLEAKSPGEIEGLRMPAYNDNVQSNGRHGDVRPLTLWERFVGALA